MKLLVLCMMAVVWLQLLTAGNANISSSSHFLRSKRNNIDRSPEGQAFQAVFREAVANGRFEDDYFETPEWKAFAEKMSNDPSFPVTWNEANVIEALKSYVSGQWEADAEDYEGDFFNSPEWNAYERTAPKSGCKKPQPELLAAIDEEFQQDWRFANKFIITMEKLCERI